MMEPEKGKSYILKRKTFLHKGVFVLTGTPVIIMEKKSEGYVVEYRDREGLVHYIEGIQAEELGAA